MNFSFQLNYPVIRAEIVFKIYEGSALYNRTNQNYFCEREQITKDGWRFSTVGGNRISDRLYGSGVQAQNNGIAQFSNGNFSMQIDIYVETYGEWTYLPDHDDNNVAEPYVIFRTNAGDDFYWFDYENDQGQSSGTGETDIFTGFTQVGSDFIGVFNPPPISEFVKTGNVSQPIGGSLWIRSREGEQGAVFRKRTGGPDRDRDEIDYAGPHAANRVPFANANRMTPNIVLETGEIVGTAEIVLMRATTVASGNSYTFSTGSGNPVEIDIILHLNADYAFDVTSIELMSISNANILTPNFAGLPNTIRALPANTYNVLFRNIDGSTTNNSIFRFDRGAAGTGIQFRFNY